MDDSGNKFVLKQDPDTEKTTYLCKTCGHEGESASQCDGCGMKFTEQTTPKTPTGGKPFVCNTCNKSFTVKCSLTRHEQTHSDDRQFGCDQCSAAFGRKEGLVRHKQNVHEGERPHVCTFCNKSFGLKSNLKVHIRTHTGEKPFVCNVCSAAFGDRSSLRFHKFKHTKDMPFHCGLCPKMFSQRNELLRHLHMHTGERPFQCDICRRCFLDSKNLRRHMQKHSVGRMFPCLYCKNTFYSQSAVNHHLVVKHKVDESLLVVSYDWESIKDDEQVMENQSELETTAEHQDVGFEDIASTSSSGCEEMKPVALDEPTANDIFENHLRLDSKQIENEYLEPAFSGKDDS